MMSQNAPVVRWMTRGLILLFCLLFTGCSSQGTISGQITYQGKPVPEGTVVMVPAEGQAVTGIIKDGHYEVKGIVKGMVKIAVQTTESAAVNRSVQRIPKGMGPPKELGLDPAIYDPSAQRQVKSMRIPEKYRDPEQSGLTYTVKGGKQEFNIDLK
jgi:hypothetical protein